MKQRATIAFALLFVTTFPSLARAAQLRVPGEFPTIQAAFDASQARDTVLVASGSYHEFLVSPAHSVALFGESMPDSAFPEAWTVLDPIPLPDADTPSVFVATCDTLLVKNFVFFNREALREYDLATRTGGIEFQGAFLDVQDCRFDSVSRAIRGNSHVKLAGCRFTACLWWCVYPRVYGRITATNCRFHGRNSYWLAKSYSNSLYENCEFVSDTMGGYLLELTGSSMTVRGCSFGPNVGNFPALTIWAQANCLIEDCRFANFENMDECIHVDHECTETDEHPLIIRNCEFRDYHATPPRQGMSGIEVRCDDELSGDIGLIESCQFKHGSGVSAPGVFAFGSVEINNCTFDSLASTHYADVRAANGAGDSLLARNNIFLPPGEAASTAGAVFDARWNWWGDSTGPYHVGQNPDGRGTEVGSNVDFIPWLLSPPDSTDTSEVSVDVSELLLPESYSVSAYPNPFNANVTLMLEVASPGVYALQLYDVTGREVAQVYRGMIRDRKELRYANPELASGVYFARLSGSTGELATAKLLLLK